MSAHSLSRKEGWRAYADAPPRQRPERLTPEALATLSDPARNEYNGRRNTCHANLKTLRTPQLDAAHEIIDIVVEANGTDLGEIRGAVAVDALAGLGKSTIINTYARQFDRDQIKAQGTLTPAGHQRIPVFRVALTGSTTIATLNRRICEFYGHPAARRDRINGELLGTYALDCVLSCDTAIGIIDDLHFIVPRRKDGMDVTNHLKSLSSEFPITILYAGVGLEKRGFFKDDQLARRWTPVAVTAFEVATDQGRRHWLGLLKATERELVLARARPGMLVREADYLFERTTGHIASYFSLIKRGCRQAIATGKEELTRELLDGVGIDHAAEQARRELAASFAAGQLTTRPQITTKSSQTA